MKPSTRKLNTPGKELRGSIRRLQKHFVQLKQCRIKIGWVIVCLLAGISCKDLYNPSIISKDYNYLVVEGFIDNGTTPTHIRLTRTRRLGLEARIVPEFKAKVSVVGEGNESYALTEGNEGDYFATLTLDNAKQYSLQIKTADGNEYRSAAVSLKKAPLIDSVYWQKNQEGVQIYLTTHDPQNNTKYYRWEYEETWEYHMYDTSFFEFKPNLLKVVPRDTPLVNVCWRTLLSNKILLGSTEKFTADLIHAFPLVKIVQDSDDAWKLGALYSILVKQYAFSKEAFAYWLNMKKNTEQLGSIFDPQPTEIKGNITCVNNPAETVIGYISAGTSATQRIFVKVPRWTYEIPCSDSSERRLKKLEMFLPKDTIGPFIEPYVPMREVMRGGELIGYQSADYICVDCRAYKGEPRKPSYWP